MKGSNLQQTYRLFLCARCRGQVSICASCDRGQLYCGQGCAQQSRRERAHSAGQRYQQSEQGRQRHAERQARYRRRRRLERSGNGSSDSTTQEPPAPPLQPAGPESLRVTTMPESRCVPAASVVTCTLCGARCQPYARYASLRERQRRRASCNGAPRAAHQPAGPPPAPPAGMMLKRLPSGSGPVPTTAGGPRGFHQIYAAFLSRRHGLLFRRATRNGLLHSSVVPPPLFSNRRA